MDEQTFSLLLLLAAVVAVVLWHAVAPVLLVARGLFR